MQSSNVIWLLPAQRKLQEALCLSGVEFDQLQQQTAALSGRLAAIFPQAQSIVVVDRLAGFRNAPGKHVLRVQVNYPDRADGYVLKLTSEEEACNERRGWRSAQGAGGQRSRVLMTLSQPPAGAAPRAVGTAVVYEDAQWSLVADEVITLEQAVRRCCRWGTPEINSIIHVLDQVFTELGAQLYSISQVVSDPQKLASGLQQRLNPGRERWLQSRHLGQWHSAVVEELLSKPGFHDPCDLLSRALHDGAFLPSMRQGLAHGDLHGRNMLVAVTAERAVFPAIFDYEDMGPDNLVAWDFVKLETELKVRVLADLYAGDLRDFIRAAQRFEQRLNEETERRNDLNFEHWSAVRDIQEPQDRLLAVLLALRRHAKWCLEVMHQEQRRWLHEYYFLLAAYAVYAGKFDSYTPREAVALLVCSGCDAARYAWAYTSLANPLREAENRARQAIARGDVTAKPDLKTLLTHHAGLAFARVFARSGRKEFVEAAVDILRQLKDRFSQVPDVYQELALAYAELARLTQNRDHHRAAEEVLIELNNVCPSPHFETLCRWGRLWKDRGDEQFRSSGQIEAASGEYQRALEYYDQAYSLADDQQRYYPGINVATLSLLLGDNERARQMAQKIVADLEQRPQNMSEETMWIQATLGEAKLLLRRGAEAEEHYRRAVRHPACGSHARQAMKAQAERILRVQSVGDFDPSRVFGSS